MSTSTAIRTFRFLAIAVVPMCSAVGQVTVNPSDTTDSGAFVAWATRAATPLASLNGSSLLVTPPSCRDSRRSREARVSSHSARVSTIRTNSSCFASLATTIRANAGQIAGARSTMRSHTALVAGQSSCTRE